MESTVTAWSVTPFNFFFLLKRFDQITKHPQMYEVFAIQMCEVFAIQMCEVFVTKIIYEVFTIQMYEVFTIHTCFPPTRRQGLPDWGGAGGDRLCSVLSAGYDRVADEGIQT